MWGGSGAKSPAELSGGGFGPIIFDGCSLTAPAVSPTIGAETSPPELGLAPDAPQFMVHWIVALRDW